MELTTDQISRIDESLKCFGFVDVPEFALATWRSGMIQAITQDTAKGLEFGKALQLANGDISFIVELNLRAEARAAER